MKKYILSSFVPCLVLSSLLFTPTIANASIFSYQNVGSFLNWIGIPYVGTNSQANVLTSIVNALSYSPSTTPTPTVTPSSRHTVILLVDSTLVSGLSRELNTWSQDVQRELGASTVIRSVTSQDTVFTLKSYVINFYKSNVLDGVLMIGNVPTGQFDVGADPILSSQGLDLRDNVYQDVINACPYSAEKGAFEIWNNPDCQAIGTTVQPFWVARLTPNSTTVSSLNLLKNYFDRNHKFRTGVTSFQNNLLVYAPIIQGDPTESILLTNFRSSMSSFGTYSNGNNLIVDQDNANSDQQYLTALSSPYRYEAFILDAHGLPTFHQKNIVPLNLVPSDSPKDVIPSGISSTSFVYGNIISCSVGRFTTADYLAGEYLFKGGLIVTAGATPIFGSFTYDKEEYYLLSQGVPFYKVFAYKGVGVNILGDPTLRLRYNNITNGSRSRLSVSTSNLSLSKNNPLGSITIKNTGTTPLLFTEKSEYMQQKNVAIIRGFTSGFLDSNAGYENGMYSLAPGKTTTLSIPSDTFFPYDTIPAGLYKMKLYIVSNDPQKALTEINVAYTSTNTSTSTPPVVQPASTVVSYPNGGETVHLNDSVNIRWTFQNWTGEKVGIDLVGQDGNSTTLVTDITNTGSYTWNVGSSVQNGQYKVHVYSIEKGGSGMGKEDYSNSYFTITSGAQNTMIINSPKSGDVWNQGNAYAISWTPYIGDFDEYEVLLSNVVVPNVQGGLPPVSAVSKNMNSVSFNGADLSSNFIQSWVMNASNYGLNVTEQSIRNNFYYVVQAIKNQSSGKIQVVASAKSGTFSISTGSTNVPIPVQSSISVLSPTSGYMISLGKSIPITWGGMWSGNDTFDVTLSSPSGGKEAIALGLTQNQVGCDGYGKGVCGYNWSPDEIYNNARITIYKHGTNDYGNSGVFSVTQSTASCVAGQVWNGSVCVSSVTTPTPSPVVAPINSYIQVMTPNGGESLSQGLPITVSWKMNYNSNSMIIFLYSLTLGNVYTSTTMIGTAGDQKGQNLASIPTSGIGPGQYKVQVCDNNQSPLGQPGKALCDMSDNYFSLYQ